MASIVFDLDGTLIDSAPDIQRIANCILKEGGHLLISMQETKEFIGNGAGIFVKKMCAARSIPVVDHELYLNKFLHLYAGAVNLTKIYPGVVGALNHLKNSNHALGICTNKPIGPCRSILAHLRIIDYFDIIIAGDSLQVRKPNPAPLQKAISLLNREPAFYVGDSEVDAETAERAAVPFIMFTEGYQKTLMDQFIPVSVFHDFQNLPDIVMCLIEQNQTRHS